MRELHGVMAPHVIDNPESSLKQRALLFDAIHIVGLERVIGNLDRVLSLQGAAEQTNWPERRAELDYLISRGFLVSETVDDAGAPDGFSQRPFDPDSYPDDDMEARRWLASAVRSLARDLDIGSRQAVPIFDSIDAFHFSGPLPAKSPRPADVLSIALDTFPSPGGGSSWADIFAFTHDQHDKQWDFRRFLHTLATKNQTEAEIRDDLEWTVNEYRKEMDRHRIKQSVSFLETYIIPTVEALESFKPSSFLKGLVSIKRRRIELLEGEAKAPGRECAYVFDTRKRFGRDL